MASDAAAPSSPAFADSPLSITANVAGILTFLYAVAAGLIGYAYLLRAAAPASVDRFYDAFAACALESDLVRRDMLAAQRALAHDSAPPTEPAPARLTSGPARQDTEATLREPGPAGSVGPRPTKPAGPGAVENMDPDSLGRLFEHVRAVEIELQTQAARVIRSRPTEAQGERGLVDRLLGRGRWASRARELEASLGKRETLTARLLVVQMSLMSARVNRQADELQRLRDHVEASDADLRRLRDAMSDGGGRAGVKVYTNGPS